MFALRNIFLKEYGCEKDLPAIFKDPAYLNINKLKLCTSTVPSDNIRNAGFCPPAEDGYGIAYMIRKNYCWFTTTSYLENVDNEIFDHIYNPKLVDALFWSLKDIQELFHSVKMTKKTMI